MGIHMLASPRKSCVPRALSTVRRATFEDFDAAIDARPPVDDRLVHSLPIAAIRPSQRNPRQRIDVDELADSLRARTGPMAIRHDLARLLGQPRLAAGRRAGPKLQRGSISHKNPSRGTVVRREEVGNGHIGEVGIGIPRLSVGKGELCVFRDEMDVVSREKACGAQTVCLEQAQLLEEHGSLAPGPDLGHGPVLEIRCYRVLVPCPEAGEVRARQQAAMRSARAVHELVAAVALDGLSDKT